MDNIAIIYEEAKDYIALEKAFRAEKLEYKMVRVDDNLEEFDKVVYLGNNPSKICKTLDKCVEQKIVKFVFVGDIVAYYARKKLTDSINYHQYTKNAIECERVVLSYSDRLNVSILEIPYIDVPSEIFAVKGVPAINLKRFYLVFDGGRSIISKENASQAVIAVLSNGENGVCYPIVDKCDKYKVLLADRLGEDAKIFEYPSELVFIIIALIKWRLKKDNKTFSFDIKRLYKETLNSNYFVNDEEVKKSLKY